MANEGIELLICPFDNPLTTKWLLPNRLEPKTMEELGGNGGGSFRVHRDDPKYVADPTMLDSRNVAKIKVDNKIIGAFLIGDKESVLVSSGENKERGYSVSGEGLKAWFDDAEVYPMTGDLEPYSRDTRSFNFASEQGAWYNPAAWVNPTNYGVYGTGIWANFPEKWPAVAKAASWIGSRAYNISMPIGVWYARHEFTIVTPGRYVIYSAVDDYFDMYLDGQHIAATKEEGESWKSTARIELTLDAGPHILAYAAYNEGGPSSLLMGMASVAADKTETLFTHSGVGTWKVLDFPASVPGWSIGEILLKLLDEAEDRGVLFPQWLTPTFTALEDSNGVSWPPSLDWAFSVGESYASVISKFEDLVSIWIDPETLELNVASTRGEDRVSSPYTAWTEMARNYYNTPSAELGTTFVTVKQNLATNPNAVPGGAGFQTNNAAIWTVDLQNAGSSSNPQGIVTRARSQFNGAQSVPEIMSMYNIDQQGNTGVARNIGAWFYVTNSGYEVLVGDPATGTYTPIPSSTWTWVTGAIAANIYAQARVRKTTGNAGASDIAYITGVTAITSGFPFATIAGGTPYPSLAAPDPDLEVVWLTTANASVSNLRGTQVTGINGTNGVVVRSTQWAKNGQYSARFIPTSGTSNTTYAQLTITLSPALQAAGTVKASLYLPAPLTGSLNASRHLVEALTPSFSTPVSAVNNIPGVYDLTLKYTNLTSNFMIRLKHGGMWGSGDIFWDNIGVFAGDYEGSWFGGASDASEFTQSRFVGTVNNSETVKEFRTTDPSGLVEFRIGKHLREARTRSKGKIKNVLAIKSTGGWSEEVDTTSVNKYGRIEGTMDTGASAELVPILSDIVFAQRATEEEGASYDIVALDKIPFVDFGVGDWVLAPNDRGLMVPRRVMSISVTEGPSGNALYTIEFDTIFRDNEQQMGKILGKMGGGGVGGSMGNVSGSTPGVGGPIILPPDSTPAPIYPKAPTGLSATSTGAWNPNGIDTISTMVLDWNDVTQNVDNTATVPQFYEIEGRESFTPATGWQPFGRTSASTITLPIFEPGDSWVFRVRAINPDGQSGAWSTELTHIMIGPTAAMLAPTTPTVSVYKGIAQVSWNGNLSNSAPPPAQFRYIYAEHRITAINGTPIAGAWTQNGNPILRDNRLTFFTNIIKGWTFEVRFTAVDGAGIQSAKSATSAPIVMTGVNLGELDGDVADAIQAAEDAATAAQGAADAAQIAADLAQDDVDTLELDVDALALEVADALATADQAISLIDGAITWSPNAPLVGDGTGKPIDAIWYRTSANGIIGQWRWTGSAWTTSPIDSDAIFSLNAVKITAGTLDAARIAANSITAGKLLIGNFDNQLPDPQFLNVTVSGWNAANFQFMAGGGRAATTNALRIVGTGVQKGAYNTINIPVREGDIYRISVWVRSSIALGAVSNLLGPYFQVDRLGTTMVNAGLNNATALVANTWTKLEANMTIPAGGYQARAGFFAQAPLTAGATLDFTEPEMVRVSDATLIADGSITTNKIQALAIVASHIVAGTITGDKISAGTISTSRLLITSLENLVENGSFEYTTAGGTGWTLGTASDTIAAANARTGSRTLQMVTAGSARVSAATLDAFAVEAGQKYRIEAWMRTLTGAMGTEGIALRFAWGTTEASTPTASADIALMVEGTTTTYTVTTGVWTVPAGARYARVNVVMRDTAAAGTRTYLVDDVAVFKMTEGNLIVDGAVTASKVAAEAISAQHIAALAIATPHLQAQAVTSEKVAADSITANHIAVGAIEADAISVGAVKTQHISPEVGGQLDISANDTVQIIAGRVDGVESETNANTENLEVMQTFYSFGPTGAVISSPGSAYSLALRNDIIEMLENGNPVSYWNSGTLYVNQFVGEKVSLGNHQLAKFEDGTVVRALGA